MHPSTLFKRALQEKLAEVRKHAFIPMSTKEGAQAAGPGGAPVDPMAAAGGAPPGAPMDPAAAGGMPPPGAMDPMAAGGMPPPPPGGDPMAGGGMPPPPGGDPMAGGDPAAAGGMPPPPPMLEEPPAPPEEEVNQAATDVDGDGKPDTMVPISAIKDFAIGLVEAMKGKKTQDALPPEPKGAGGAADAGPQPGPVTGIPGDMSGMMGPFKTASVLARHIKGK